jgi:hypothetical protein
VWSINRSSGLQKLLAKIVIEERHSVALSDRFRLAKAFFGYAPFHAEGSMRRKLLFLVFTDEPCKQTHAFLYALDLHKKGYDVRLIVEGHATRSFAKLDDPSCTFAKVFAEANGLGIVAGACKTASRGCGSQDSSVEKTVSAQSVALLDDMDGHAGIEPFIRDGYEVLVF